MNPSARPRLVVHVSIPKVQPVADDGADEGAPACGWFDSSYALRQGLAVQELPDSDGTVAALWFQALAAAPASAPLQ
jgi:hypothetical protein